LNAHISAAMRAFIEVHPDWLTEARLPAYAPDLSPVEGAWANGQRISPQGYDFMTST
jgi:transposase